MQKKRTGRMLCSLALSAVTLWGVSVTAPAKDARDALRSLKDETLGVMLLRYERGDGGEDFLSLRTSLALHATPLLREGEENIAQAWSAELEQKPDDSADETGDAQDNEGTVLTQEETPDEIAVTENGSPARTLKASDPSGYTVFGNVYINNGSDAALDASMLAGDYAAKLGAEGPQVLIIHTHGSESYTMPPGQEYDVSDTFRTLDTNCNMIRIGDEMAQVLTERASASCTTARSTTIRAIRARTTARSRRSRAICKSTPRSRSCSMCTATRCRTRTASSSSCCAAKIKTPHSSNSSSGRTAAA